MLPLHPNPSRRIWIDEKMRPVAPHLERIFIGEGDHEASVLFTKKMLEEEPASVVEKLDSELDTVIEKAAL